MFQQKMCQIKTTPYTSSFINNVFMNVSLTVDVRVISNIASFTWWTQ